MCVPCKYPVHEHKTSREQFSKSFLDITVKFTKFFQIFERKEKIIKFIKPNGKL